MPTREDGITRVFRVDGGLYSRANPLLIKEDQASSVLNFDFNKQSAEESFGLRKLNDRKPVQGGVRISPVSSRTTAKSVTKWSDGYLFAPMTTRLRLEPNQIDAHVRMEEPLFYPDTGVGVQPIVTGGLTGRDGSVAGDTIGQDQRRGGEHQFFPIVSRGARDCEAPWWTLGIGCVFPQGLKDGTGFAVGRKDAISPVFAWWDSVNHRMNVSAANILLEADRDYSITLRFDNAGNGTWWVNGLNYGFKSTFGLSTPPARNALSRSDFPIYFGRCFPREPDLYYDAGSGNQDKHAYMGKYDVTVGVPGGGAGAITLPVVNQQLATVAGNPYVNYRCRVVTGAGAGDIYLINGVNTPTVDGTIQIVIDAPVTHGIVNGDMVDIVPAIEPVSMDATIQEVRLWTEPQADAVIANLQNRQAVSDPNKTTILENPLSNPVIGNASEKEIIAYWPLNEDGGIVCRDKLGRSDAYFAPSLVTVDKGTAPSSSDQVMWLDGETHAIQVDLRDDPNFVRNHVYNLGKIFNGRQHWNVCVRMEFCLGSSTAVISGGATTDHLYQTLFSIGDPVNGTTILEARLTNHGPGPNEPWTIYFVLPDGTTQVLALTDTSGNPAIPQHGIWYNAILGIEALDATVANPNRHYCYFQAADAGLNFVGAFSNAFDLPGTQPGGLEIDPEKEYILSFGASVAGVSNKGAHRNNHAMIGLGCLGYGFHPAHIIDAAAAPSSGPMLLGELARWIRFSRLEVRSDTRPGVIGVAAGVEVTKGTNTITELTGDDLPPELRRWPLELEEVSLVHREAGEADRDVLDNVVVSSVSGAQATLVRAHTGATVRGAELRVRLWQGFTNFQTPEVPADLDLNTGREPGEQWARTEGVLIDLAESLPGFQVCVDPHTEFVSPFKVAPRWDQGIVRRGDIEVSGVFQQKISTGEQALLAVAGGSLFEVDNRWRRGNPFDELGYAFEFRNRPRPKTLELAASDEGLQLFSAATKPLVEEGLVLDDSGSLKPLIDPTFNVTTLTPWVWECDIWVESLDGIRTIGGAGLVTAPALAGYVWKKNWHLFLDNGHLTFEIRDDVTGVLWRMETSHDNSPAIRPKEWTRILCEIYMEDLVGTDTITGGSFMVNGKHVQAVDVDANITLASVPNLSANSGLATLGAVGYRVNGGLYGGLGGRMSFFRMAREFPYGSTGGQSDEYDPAEITGVGTALTAAQVLFNEGTGARLLQHSATVQKRARFFGHSMVHLGSGMGDTSGRQVAFATHNDIVYITTGLTRPWRYDLRRQEFTEAGLRPPVGKIKEAEIVRMPFRLRGEGADVPSSIGVANKAVLASGVPHLLTFAGAAPVPGAADEGALVHVPADPDMGAATQWPPGYVGVVTLIRTTPAYDLAPAPTVAHAIGVNDASWALHRRYKNNDAAVAAAKRYKLAIANGPESTTPWHERRLLPDGKDDVDVPREEDGLTVPAEGNSACAAFRGNRFIELPPFEADGMPVAQDVVLDVKGYLRIDDIDTLGDDEQVIFERAVDVNTASWRLVMTNGGRLRFEFFDIKLGAFRSISTVGQVLTPLQWYYVRFRYRFKASGSHVFDTSGGWEPDLRWTRRGVTFPEYQKESNFRDGLWVVACEGLHQISEAGSKASDPAIGYRGDVFAGAACPFLTVPGCESQVGGAVADGTPATHNHSQALLNTGLLKSAPYLTPERGDGLFPAAGASSLVDSGVELTVVANTIQSLATAVGGGVAVNFQLPSGFALPRMCSMNRDDAWNRQQDSAATSWSQIWSDTVAANENWYNQNTFMTALQAAVSFTPNLSNFGIAGGGDTYGKREGWAVLVRIWTVTFDGGSGATVGNAVNKATADDARVLALVHLGNGDLGNASRGGVSGGTLYLTDDPIYGGDGLGQLVEGATILGANDRVHATFELMNGSNQSVNSPNRNCVPSLLEHGANPVGVEDSPDQTLAPIRFGGTVAQAEERIVKSGLRGRMDEWGFLVATLIPETVNTYAQDELPPDAFFYGPSDTRFQSLPRLTFGLNNAILDNVSGSTATRATAVLRMDDLSGDFALVDTRSPTWLAVAYSSAQASNGVVQRRSKGLLERGEHRIRVTFYDPDQDIESNPSDEIVVKLDGESDAGDPIDAESTFALVGVPVSGQRRRRLWRRIYKTLGGGATALLWAEIKDNTTVSFTPRADFVRLALGRELDFNNARPPICEALITSETNMFYVGVDDAPNVVSVSKAFRPDLVPGNIILYGESGKGGGLLGAGFLRGIIVLAKRNAIFVSEPSGAAFRTKRVGQAVGCLSHGGFAEFDGMLFFPSQKGVYAFLGNQRAFSISDPIEDVYRQQVDIRRMDRSHGVSLMDRAQYLLSAHALGFDDPLSVLTTERRFDQFGNNYYVWSIINHSIPFFSLTEYEERYAEVGKVAVGSRGFVLQYDTGPGVGTGSESFLEGSLIGAVVGASSGVGVMKVDGLNAANEGMNAHFDGHAGAQVIVAQETDVNGTVVAIGSGCRVNVVTAEIALTLRDATNPNTEGFIYTKEQIDWSTLDNAFVAIGGMTHFYTTMWFDIGVPESFKSGRYLDLHFDKVSGGVVFVEIYGDFDTSTVCKCFRVPLDNGFFSLPIPEITARWLQLRFSVFGHRVGFVLHQYALRTDPHDWGRRQHA